MYSTINFTNLYANFNSGTEMKNIYRRLFYGSQNREVYINAPYEFPAHTFDS
jgi:hypothetical protein